MAHQSLEGSTDIGGSRTSIAMQLAEVLGLEADDINPMVGDKTRRDIPMSLEESCDICYRHDATKRAMIYSNK